MPYFSPVEFECGCSQLDCSAPDMDLAFLGLLNTLRELWGRPLSVNSGARCLFWNAHVGGAPGSQHTLGKAADLRVTSRDEADQLALLATKVGFTGLGIYATWLHVDTGPKRTWAG